MHRQDWQCESPLEDASMPHGMRRYHVRHNVRIAMVTSAGTRNLAVCTQTRHRAMGFHQGECVNRILNLNVGFMV
jgi:hypothetical protein